MLPDRDVLVHLPDDFFDDRDRYPRVSIGFVLAECKTRIDRFMVDRGVRQQEHRLADTGEAGDRAAHPVRFDRNLSLHLPAWSVHFHVLDRAPNMSVEMKLRLGDVLGPVHMPEVRPVDAVLAHLLWMTADRPAVPFETRPTLVGKLGHLRNLPARCLARAVMPGPDHVIALDAVPRANFGFGRNALGVGYVSTHASAIELPCVKRTTKVIAGDDATVTEVRTEVGTECIEERDITPHGPKKHQILAEVPQGNHGFGIELVAVRNLKPTVWNRKRQSFAHGGV